jgi:hypothetical protein
MLAPAPQAHELLAAREAELEAVRAELTRAYAELQRAKEEARLASQLDTRPRDVAQHVVMHAAQATPEHMPGPVDQADTARLASSGSGPSAGAASSGQAVQTHGETEAQPVGDTGPAALDWVRKWDARTGRFYYASALLRQTTWQVSRFVLKRSVFFLNASATYDWVKSSVVW